ncbi:hypothetical protein H0266_18200 [Halobacillus locisalis]|uniref:Uncharacterized protein n=1 Tax=Halobacillus locisalis TaxID=220753 RepID=A0A838CY12_9BACI|nr:hypothetical protein [Halobacillus locisalis]MBA2176814.1 hypothetical protein [Halobacillus locisalis]
MIDARTEKGKLQLILELIDREDLRHQLDQELTDAQHEELLAKIANSIAEETEQFKLRSVAH